jgi:thiol-disulfide isomerase/thioredoxin
MESDGLAMRRGQFLIVFLVFSFIYFVMPNESLAQIDFFKTQPGPRVLGPANVNHSKVRVIFFVAPGCHSCPEESAKIQRELTTAGWKYEIEGIFVGDPAQLGRYLAALRGYPFDFELGLDMDGKVAKQYGVNTFPTAVVEVDGKRMVVTRASELSEKLR